jgi:hypothetical protein
VRAEIKWTEDKLDAFEKGLVFLRKDAIEVVHEFAVPYVLRDVSDIEFRFQEATVGIYRVVVDPEFRVE